VFDDLLALGEKLGLTLKKELNPAGGPGAAGPG
jgi:hypothetical protein